MDTVTCIINLIEKCNFSAKHILSELELSASSISDWRRGKAKPSTDAIIKFANYFNVSTDYLLLGKENVFDISNDEKIWLELYRQLPIDDRRECIGYVKGVIACSQKELKKEVKQDQQKIVG